MMNAFLIYFLFRHIQDNFDHREGSKADLVIKKKQFNCPYKRHASFYFTLHRHDISAQAAHLDPR